MNEGVYIKMRDYYLENARIAISKKEWRKASELLWGAITQSIKAVGSCKGISIVRHRDFFSFVKEITKETNDEEYYSLFLDLNGLHINFYDEVIPPEELLERYYPKAISFIEKLNNLMNII